MNKILCLILAIAVQFTMVGCAVPVKPESGSEAVRLTEYLTPEERTQLKEINMVTCELGENARSQDTNVEACRNKLRNDALKLGGTVVLLSPEQQVVGKTVTNMLTGTEYCPNCVKMRGIVYGKK